jgi:hypothetical protein
MKDRNMGFVVSLKAEAARLENAIELAEHQVSRFPRNHKRERSLEVIKAHLNRVERTIKEVEVE